MSDAVSLTFITLLTLLLLVAALQDIATLRISNLISVAILILFPIYCALRPETQWMPHVATFVATTTLMLLAYRFRVMGGGDIKLISATSIWFNHAQILQVLGLIVTFGALVALVFLFARRAMPAGLYDWSKWAALKPRGPIPYGLAISAGTVLGLNLYPLI